MPLFVIGMVTYPFGYHFTCFMLPFVGLLFDIFLVKFIGNFALTSKWLRFIATSSVCIIENKEDRDYSREDIKALVDAIIVVVDRIYFVGDEVPSFRRLL